MAHADTLTDPTLTDDGIAIPDAKNRMTTMESDIALISTEFILDALKQDQVVLIKNATQEDADTIMENTADALGIKDSLEIQSGFAEIQGHRTNIGLNYMSVNKTEAYEFIPPHSEGNRTVNMQLASLFCDQNTTDGGVSILFSVNSDSEALNNLQEAAWKLKVTGRELSETEVAQAKMQWQINLPEDYLNDSDNILRLRDNQTPGIELYEVLVKPPKTYSYILGREVAVYWDNIASADQDSVDQYRRFLENYDLLKLPSSGATTEQLDHASKRRAWRSGVRFSDLFTSKIMYKLAPGDMIIMNNLTWTHANSNWTPGSGVRKLSAAFA